MFSELVTSGLVTLNNGRGIAFGSGISRLQTPGGAPAAGDPEPRDGHEDRHRLAGHGSADGGARGDHRARTEEEDRSDRRCGRGVVLVGGAGALFALDGGKSKATPAPAVATPTPEPAKVAPEPAKPEPEPAKAPEPAKPVEVAKPAPARSTS